MKHVIIYITIAGALVSCMEQGEKLRYDHWYVTGKILMAGEGETMDNVAVKDPSIVCYKGRYHLFYTAKSVRRINEAMQYRTGCGYVSAGTLEGLQRAVRISVDSLAGCPVIAPQIFYFEPQHCWYLVAHSPVESNNLHRLKPVFLTNPRIEDPSGWSEAREIPTGKAENGFWIDFWIICDAQRAYMFYADQEGSVYRLSCDLEQFPEGFRRSIPEKAIHVVHNDCERPWRLFEAAHIYYVRNEDIYLALLEGAYSHPSREGDVDSRNRFIFGMTADSLDGAWKRVEKNDCTFLAEAGNLLHMDGSPVTYTMVSHPELIRSGYDQLLEIDDYHLTMIFQGFNGSEVPGNYNYNALPWELVVMKNFR
jgi:endo-1,4-beta-xylanase